MRDELKGVFELIQNMAGGAVDRAAQAAELQALHAGDKVSAAAAKGQAARRQAEADARAQQLGGGIFGRAVAGAQQWWDEGGDRIAQELAAAREEARKREREANRTTGRGGSATKGLGAISSVKEEIARLKPSYDADIAAADAWRAKALASLDKTKAGYDAFAKDVQTVFNEKVAKAYRDDLERRDDWAAGAERAQLKISDDLMSWADLSESIFTSFAQSGEDAFVKLTTRGKFQIGDMANFVSEQFARMAYQQAIQPGMSAIFDGVSGWLGKAVSGWMGGGASVTVPTNHTGSPGVMRTYSLGGYGDTPRQDERLTMVRDGEEIMTSRALENAGALISDLSAAVARNNQPVAIDSRPIINPVNRTSHDFDVSVEETTDGRGQRQYALVMSDAVSTGLAARGGKAQRTLRNQFGVSRPGVVRP